MVDLEVQLNKFFLDETQDRNQDLQLFIDSLPKGEALTNTIKFLNSLNYSEINEFKNLLYSRSDVSEITKDDYTSVIGSKLFDLEPKGLGKAEIFLACILKNSKVSGGGQSFDLSVGGQLYEVKDYRKALSKPIRLGTKGKVTRFKFWHELLKTIRLVKKHREFLANTSCVELVDLILQNEEFILGGELNKSMVCNFNELYEQLHIESSNDNSTTSYNYIKFYSSSSSPYICTTRYIEKLSNKIIIHLEDYNQVDVAVCDLRRVLYVRNPSRFHIDLQNAVDDCINPNIPFIIFRPTGPVITTKFKFYSVSQGGIYIQEIY